MAYLVIEDFRAGQDSRKSKVTSPPGTIVRLTNAHINAGGEIESRKAFANAYALPAGTFGMAAASNALYVFGSAASPVGLPAGVNYQRLQNGSGSTMTAVLQAEVFNGKLYVIATYSDSSTHHFYDGTRVSDWFDGRARGSFEVTGGSALAGTSATTTITITGGTSSPGVNKVSSITVGGVEVLGSAVDWATSNDATATAVAAQITSYASSPEYTAAAVGAVVTITKTLTGVAGNALAVVVTNGGDVTNSGAANTAGGVDPNALATVTVNGVDVLGARVLWTTTNNATAAAIVSQINSYTSSPEYTAVAVDATVFVIAAAGAGAGPNGFELNTTVFGNVTIGSETDLGGGQVLAGTFTPGTACRTIKTKMYVVSSSVLNYSKVNDPTLYNSEHVGAGFIQMSNHAAGSEELTGIEIYLSFAAIFAKDAIQIWSLFADDDLNEQQQVIRNVGTLASRSIIGLRSGDVVFLARDGIRSLRSTGDVNNTATVFELGTAIDKQVREHVDSLSAATAARALAVVEPRQGLLWLSIDTRVFVFSFHSGAKISAWSEYLPGFAISDFAVIGNLLYARSGNTIYLYGGEAGTTYDSCTVTAELPFIDGKTIATWKEWTGIDASVDGVWSLSFAADVTQPDTYSAAAVISGATFDEPRLAVTSNGTHLAPKLVSTYDGYKRVANLVLHYEALAPS